MMSKSQKFLWSCFLILFMSISEAQSVIYQNTGTDGATQFSDVPSAGSNPIHLSQNAASGYNAAVSSSAMSSPSTDNSSSQSTAITTGKQENKQINYVLNIASPADQTTFQNQLPIAVMVTTEPNLQESDKVQLIIDGKPYGEPQGDLTFSVEGLERGTHQFQVRAINGTTHDPVSVSSTITIYKQQASLLLPTQATLSNVKPATLVKK